MRSAAHGEVCLAVDEGVLVKAGADVRVSARRAIGGADLGRLRDAVAREFVQQDAQEHDAARGDGAARRRLPAPLREAANDD